MTVDKIGEDKVLFRLELGNSVAFLRYLLLVLMPVEERSRGNCEIERIRIVCFKN